ncbi:MAG: hypothetical protein ACTSO2_19470 [Promethearchaeota archaeon]
MIGNESMIFNFTSKKPIRLFKIIEYCRRTSEREGKEVGLEIIKY